MRRGESGVSVVEVRPGTDFGMRDALRTIGVNPLSPGWYVITVEKVSEARVREIEAEQKKEQEAYDRANTQRTAALKGAT